MTAPPWFPFVVSQWHIDTRRLTLAEKGAHAELLAYAWEAGGLPLQQPALARIAGASMREWARVWPSILHLWRVDEMRQVMVNEHQEEKRRSAEERSSAARDSADKSWKSRRRPDANAERTQSNGTADAKQTQCDLDRDKEKEQDQPPNPLSGGTIPLGLPAGEPETGAAGGEEGREGTKQAASRKAAKPRKPKAADVLVEKHRETIAAVLDLLDAARGKLVEPDPDRAGQHLACPLPPVVRSNLENWRTIAARIEEGATVDQVHHVLGVRFAAIRAGDAAGRSYFDAITPFRSEWFARYLATDAAAAAARVRADIERRAPRPSRLAPGNAKPTPDEAERIAAQEADMDRRRRARALASMSPEDREKLAQLEAAALANGAA
jgi:uncharacterized protein YdaU (DUF1376 family)